MKITLIGPYPPFRGGISDFNYSLSKELKKNHDLQIINFTTQYPKFLFPGKTQYKSNYAESTESNRTLSSINYFAWRRTANLIIDFNPDIVIIQYWMPFFSISYNSVIKRIKRKIDTQILATCHNLIPHENKSYFEYFTKKFLKNIDKFVVMSKSVENDLLRLRNDADFITTFHPIYDLFGVTKDKKKARKDIDIKSKKILLFFGLIREYKGLDILLNSIPIIKGELNEFKLVIAGECYENDRKYAEMIANLDITNAIVWINKFISEDKVVDYFSAADVVVLPYKTATQSGVTQIAFNFNRPVIISDVGGLSEMVEDGINGYVVKPVAEDIANAIIKFFKENKTNEFSKNVSLTKDSYSWHTFANNLVQFSLK